MLKTIITRIQTKVQRCRLPLVVPALVIGMSSCVYEDEPIKTDDNSTDSKYEITFTINVGRSRGVQEDLDYYYKDDEGYSYSDGTEAENYIDPAKLHVLVYNAYESGNNFGGQSFNMELPVTSVVKLSSSQYRVTSEWDRDKIKLPDKFIVAITANWQYTPEERIAKGGYYGIDNLAYLCVYKGAEYSYHYGGNNPCSGVSIGGNDTGTNGYCNYADANGDATYFVPSKDTPIPMFGFKTYAKDATWGNHVNLGDIYLIRAMAKLIVKSTTDIQINSASLAYYYDVGYCGFAQPMESRMSGVSMYEPTKGCTDPSYYSYNYNIMEELGVPGDFTGNFGKGFDNANPTHRCTNLPFKEYTNSDSQNMYVVYIPAYNNKLTHNNIPALENKIVVNITTASGTQDYDILFKDQNGGSYDDSSLYDLWRNHMYIYDVQTVAEKQQIDYVVTEFDNFTAVPITFE